MSVGTFARPGASVAVTVLLATLAAAAPRINAEGGPPRSVFLRLPPETIQPSVAIFPMRRADGTWRLRIETENFTFTTLCLPDAEARPVGHAHVIVDGVKVASAYHPVVDLGALAAGPHDITVVLRGQDHRALLGPNGLIKAEAAVTVGMG